MSERIEFKVGKKYKNVKGFYRVISIDSKNDAMLIQWKTGEKLKTSIKLQERIIKRLSFEKSIAEKEQGLPHSVYKKNGIQKVYYIDGQIKMKIPWVNDKKHGVLKTYYQFGFIYLSLEEMKFRDFDKRGQLKNETIYVNNKKHGIEKTYHDGWVVIQTETPWVNNKKHGIEKVYYRNGKVKSEITYVDDKIVQKNNHFFSRFF